MTTQRDTGQQRLANGYERQCQLAAEAQGVDVISEALTAANINHSVEQTGGFIMVPTVHLNDGGLICVTADADYLAMLYAHEQDDDGTLLYFGDDIGAAVTAVANELYDQSPGSVGFSGEVWCRLCGWRQRLAASIPDGATFGKGHLWRHHSITCGSEAVSLAERRAAAELAIEMNAAGAASVSEYHDHVDANEAIDDHAVTAGVDLDDLDALNRVAALADEVVANLPPVTS